MNENELFESIESLVNDIDNKKLLTYIIYKQTMTEACARSASTILNLHLTEHLISPLSDKEAEQLRVDLQCEIWSQELNLLTQLRTVPMSDLYQLFQKR